MTLLKPGKLIYKCRHCGKTESLRIEDTAEHGLLVMLGNQIGKRALMDGIHNGTMQMHFCKIGNFGVMDLVGSKEIGLERGEGNG